MPRQNPRKTKRSLKTAAMLVGIGLGFLLNGCAQGNPGAAAAGNGSLLGKISGALGKIFGSGLPKLPGLPKISAAPTTPKPPAATGTPSVTTPPPQVPADGSGFKPQTGGEEQVDTPAAGGATGSPYPYDAGGVITDADAIQGNGAGVFDV